MSRLLLSSLQSRIREALVKECGGLCPIPRCERQCAEAIALDGDHRNVSDTNLLLLCEAHAAMVRAKKLDVDVVKAIKRLLDGQRFFAPVRDVRELSTRQEYLTEVRKHIILSPEYFVITYVGPLCFHPEWYFSRQEDATGIPSMDREVQNCLLQKQNSGQRLLFRNSRRYWEKVAQYVAPDEWNDLIDETIAMIDSLFMSGRQDAATVICADLGFYHIPLLFSNSAIVATRASEMAPIEGGRLLLDQALVESERAQLSLVIESRVRTLTEEVSALKAFLDGARH